MMFMGFFWIIIVIGLVVFLFRGAVPGCCGPMNMDSRDMNSALDILKRRYASGEITREEYEEKKRELQQRSRHINPPGGGR